VAVMAEGVVGILVVGVMSAAVDIFPAVVIEADTPATQAMADIEADTAAMEVTVGIEEVMAGTEVTVDIEEAMAGTEAGVGGAGPASGSACISRRFPIITQRFGTLAYLTIMRTITTTNGTAT
jgi:hypothetical protein